MHHASTSMNPCLPVEEIAYLRTTLRPEIASQELDAIFLDTGGASIFPLNMLLLDGEPHPDDGWACDYVSVAIDKGRSRSRRLRRLHLRRHSAPHWAERLAAWRAGGAPRLGHCVPSLRVVLTRGFSTFANWLGTGSCV